MNKKKWVLLFVVVLLVFGYIKLFYKTFNPTTVPQSADIIVVLDVKRVTNTLIWEFITSPSKWSISSKRKDSIPDIDWMSILKIPDYVFAFHVKNQSSNTWYSLLEIKDDAAFEKGVVQQHFSKKNKNLYLNLDFGVALFKQENEILITNIANATNENLYTVAQELFNKKLYTPKETLAKIVSAKSHLAIYFDANKYLQTATIITANFNKQKVKIRSTLSPYKEFNFTENNFIYPSNSICVLGFTQPTKPVYHLLSDSTKENLSRAIGINIDTLIQPSNIFYQLDFAAIKPRTDSAISYTYDDNFNKTEKVIVNNVQEPSFNFSIVGDSVNKIYNNWLLNKTFEVTKAGNLFRPIPFVKSYCAVQNEKRLQITSFNYAIGSTSRNNNCVFFIKLQIATMPTLLLKYLPDNLVHTMANVESVELLLKKDKQNLQLEGSIIKKDNELPIVNM